MTMTRTHAHADRIQNNFFYFPHHHQSSFYYDTHDPPTQSSFSSYMIPINYILLDTPTHKLHDSHTRYVTCPEYFTLGFLFPPIP